MNYVSKLKYFTTKEVALLCRVSEATVKRWASAGIIKSERTNGGHRRFRAEEVACFQREKNVGLKRCHSDDFTFKANFSRRKRRFFCDMPLVEALINAQEPEVADLIISEFLKKKTPAEIFDKVLCPAMTEIGRLWAKGDLSVAEEHLATRTAVNAIHKLRTVIPVPQSTGNLAVCCAVEGDFHDLPTFLAQVVFENEGWNVMNFGANMPLDGLTREIIKHTPDAVCISATFIENIEKFAENYQKMARRLENLKTRILFGGRLLTNVSIRKRFPEVVFVKKFSELAKFGLKFS